MGKSRLLPLTEQRMIQLAADAMQAKRMKGFRSHRVSGKSVQFVCDGVRSCLPAETHRGNGCFCNFMPDGSIVYHCMSARCAQHEALEIGEWEADPRAITLDALPAESLRTFDAAVTRGLEELADDWPHHRPAFQRTMMAYMNRLVIHGRQDMAADPKSPFSLDGNMSGFFTQPIHIVSSFTSSRHVRQWVTVGVCSSLWTLFPLFNNK